MLRFPALVATAIVTPFALGLVACDNPTDNTLNNLPIAEGEDSSVDDQDTDDNGAEDTDTSNGEGCDCIQEDAWYIFDSLGLESFDGKEHNVIATLNELWRQDIEKRNLNILFRVDTVTNTEVSFKAYNAARLPETTDICLLRETEITLTFPLDGCRMRGSAEAGINIYAGPTDFPLNCNNQNTPEHVIPARKVVLQGEMKDDCSTITDGVLVRGVIAKEALEQTCTCVRLGNSPASDCADLDPEYSQMIEQSTEPVCVGCNKNYQSLVELIDAFGAGDALEYIGETDEGDPAVTLTGFFSAVSLEESPEDCP